MKFSLKLLMVVVTVAAILIAATPQALNWLQWRKCCQELAAFSKTDYIEFGYQDVQDAAKPIFDRLLRDLQALPYWAGNDEKTALFEKCTKDLAELDGTHAIETVEREEFAETTFTIAKIIGCHIELDEYRDWRDGPYIPIYEPNTSNSSEGGDAVKHSHDNPKYPDLCAGDVYKQTNPDAIGTVYIDRDDYLDYPALLYGNVKDFQSAVVLEREETSKLFPNGVRFVLFETRQDPNVTTLTYYRKGDRVWAYPTSVSEMKRLGMDGLLEHVKSE